MASMERPRAVRLKTERNMTGYPYYLWKAVRAFTIVFLSRLLGGFLQWEGNFNEAIEHEKPFSTG